MKKFVYLVQAERFLPKLFEELQSEDADVFFLTWKKPSKNCLFFPMSTWAMGMNRLYEKVFHEKYLYYIFIDDDIKLKFTKYDSYKHNPWRQFENVLLRYLPAVGVPHLHEQEPSNKPIDSIYWFDAILMAIHKDALHSLFPIYDGEDNISWWNSGVYFCHQAALLYPNHILRFNNFEAINQRHREYPNNFNSEGVDNKFKQLIKKDDLKNVFRYRDNLRPLLNGEVMRKNRSYIYSNHQIEQLFDFESDIFKRKYLIQKKIEQKRDCPVCKNSKIPYWGDLSNKKLGPQATYLVFKPLVVIYEIYKKFTQVVASVLQKIFNSYHSFLETSRPLRHQLGIRGPTKKINSAAGLVGRIIEEKSEKTKDFFVIQIGSNDGVTGDPINKYVKLYKWKGIFIEPVSYIFRKLKETYKNNSGIFFENVAIHSSGGYQTFYRIRKNSERNNPIWYDQIGTFNKKIISKHKNKIPGYKNHLIKERVRCMKMTELIDKYSVIKIDLLHIDTEGYDYEIIKQIPFHIIKPQMILYEHKHLGNRDFNKCVKLLESYGYKLLKSQDDTFAYL